MKRIAGVIASLVLVVLSTVALTKDAVTEAPVTSPFDRPFWQHWGDGQAEMAGYDLSFPRYGETRKGTAVAIFVTEPFSNAQRVKADRGKHPRGDEFQVMKLNLVRDFNTGVYDYNLMTSTFVALQANGDLQPGQTAKVSFSSQEWCGHVYQQLVFREDGIEQAIHSYFDGEGDQSRKLRVQSDGISEDALFHWARGLAQPFLEPGKSVRRPLIRSLTTSRLQHVSVEWRDATFTRGDKVAPISVAAGTFPAQVWSVAVDGGGQWSFWVENQPPHRILRWRTGEGEEGSLIRSDRMPYWKMNGSQFEKSLPRLGLTPRPPRTP